MPPGCFHYASERSLRRGPTGTTGDVPAVPVGCLWLCIRKLGDQPGVTAVHKGVKGRADKSTMQPGDMGIGVTTGATVYHACKGHRLSKHSTTGSTCALYGIPRLEYCTGRFTRLSKAKTAWLGGFARSRELFRGVVNSR